MNNGGIITIHGLISKEAAKHFIMFYIRERAFVANYLHKEDAPQTIYLSASLPTSCKSFICKLLNCSSLVFLLSSRKRSKSVLFTLYSRPIKYPVSFFSLIHERTVSSLTPSSLAISGTVSHSTVLIDRTPNTFCCSL